MPLTPKTAANVLRRNAPPGEFPAFINNREASWLKGMGGSGKKTKSGLRSFQSPHERNKDKDLGGLGGSGAFAGLEGAANTVSDYVGNINTTPSDDAATRHSNFQADQARRSAAQDGGGGSGGSSAGTSWMGAGQATGSPAASSGPGGLPFLGTPGSGPGGRLPEGRMLPGSGGHQTRVPQGPGSVTNPNDPYGVQEAIATGTKDLINQGYTGPELTPEERIAQTSAETLQGRDLVQGMVGTGQDAFGEATGVGKDVSGYQAQQIGQQAFLGGQGPGVQDYMSPHTQNVIGSLQENALRTMQKGRNQLGAQAQMAGAGMGSRSALEKGVMAAEVQRDLNQQTGQLLDKSYADATRTKMGYDEMDQARQRYNQQTGLAEQDVRLRGAQQQIAGTQAGRGAAAQDIGLVSQVGADVEGRDQNVLDEQMGDFYEERDWDRNQLAAAANIYGTLPTGQTTTTTGAPQHRKKDKFGRIISGAASGWLASGGNPWGAAAGGAAGLFS